MFNGAKIRTLHKHINTLEMKRILLLFAALLTITTAKALESELEETKHITKEEFLEKVYDYEKNPDKWVFKGDKSCIFVFHATWCPPCRELMPTIQLLSFDYGERVDIYQINVDMQYELSKHFKLEHIPTIYMAPKDGSEPTVWIRVPSYEELSAKIEKDLL